MSNEQFWRVLVVDDDEQIAGQIKRLESKDHIGGGNNLQIEIVNNFDEALEIIEKSRFDFIILDVKSDGEDGDDEAGPKLLEKIKERCFLPIIFYTGLPKRVENLKSSVIQVVEKTSGVQGLISAMRQIIQSGVPKANRALNAHIEEVKRQYMWGFFAEHWGRLEVSPDANSAEIAHILARRLSLSLSNEGISSLSEKLGKPFGISIAEEAVEEVVQAGVINPIQYYIIPPVEKKFAAGDIFKGTINGLSGYWITLTPTCDFWQGSAEFILFAYCGSLDGHLVYQKWAESLPKPGTGVTNNFTRFLGNRDKERYYFLPSVINIPNMVVDFQQLNVLEKEKINSLERVASLDVIFSSEIVSRFLRYFGRRGTPNLNVDYITGALKADIQAQKESAAAVESSEE
jgi:DNA-binding response OmpR family regulator